LVAGLIYCRKARKALDLHNEKGRLSAASQLTKSSRAINGSISDSEALVSRCDLMRSPTSFMRAIEACMSLSALFRFASFSGNISGELMNPEKMVHNNPRAASDDIFYCRPAARTSPHGGSFIIVDFMLPWWWLHCILPDL